MTKETKQQIEAIRREQARKLSELLKARKHGRLQAEYVRK